MQTVTKVASFQEACLCTGDNPQDAKYTTGTPQAIAFNRLSTIAAAIRGTTQPPSFKDKTKRKYWALHYMGDEGFRFWFADCDYASANAPGGSALCFHTLEDAEYFGKQFIPEFENFYS